MPFETEATYENGILKLDQPLPLRNHERVTVAIRLPRANTGQKQEDLPHSVLDIPTISVGNVLRPLTSADDLLGEMLEDRS